MLSIATPTTRQHVRTFGTCTKKWSCHSIYCTYIYKVLRQHATIVWPKKECHGVATIVARAQLWRSYCTVLIVVIKDLIKVIEFIPSKTILGSH